MENVTVLDTGVVAHQLARLRLAPRQEDKALTLWPLVSREAPSAPSFEYVLLGDALEDGLAGISEPDGACTVEIEVENRASWPLLLLAGECLGSPGSGLVANASFVVAPRTVAPVPVQRLRGRVQPCPTGWLRRLRPLPRQLGFVSTLGDGVLGLELLGDARAFPRALPALAAAHWRRALELAFRCGPGRVPRFDAPEPFLEALSRAPTRAVRTALGERRLRLQGEGATGEGLLAGDVLVHLTAQASTTSTG
jgi:hypothetical protein